MDINLINNMLLEGKTVKEVRQGLGVSEKKFQKEIKLMGYKFDQKKKAYIKEQEPHIDTLNPLEMETTASTTQTATQSTTLTPTQSTTVNYLTENMEVLKQLLENYKRNTVPNNNKDIIINLISDKHLKPSPKSIRINEFVWRDWLEFTKDLTYNKGDLISMALKEFIENHK